MSSAALAQPPLQVVKARPRSDSLDQAIGASNQHGKLHERVFSFARQLKAIPEYQLVEPTNEAFRIAAQRWHAFMLEVGSIDNDTTVDEIRALLVSALPKVKYAAGHGIIATAWAAAQSSPIPDILQLAFDDERTWRLGAFCFQLQQLTGEEPFFLSCRVAGSLLECDHVRVSRLLRLMVTEGILEVIEKGTSRRATRYCWVGKFK